MCFVWSDKRDSKSIKKNDAWTKKIEEFWKR